MAEREQSRAAEEFIDRKMRLAELEVEVFENMRESVLDVLFELERQTDAKFVKNIKKRVLDARTTDELKVAMDGLLVLTGFTLRGQIS